VRSGVRLLVFHMGTWGFPLVGGGGGQTEGLYTGEKERTHRGRPFQSACRGWSVPTRKWGYLIVNLSLSLWLDVRLKGWSAYLRWPGRFP